MEIKEIIRWMFYTLGIILGIAINHIPTIIVFAMLDIEFTIKVAKEEIIEEIKKGRN